MKIRKLCDRILIDEWRRAWRYLSVQIQALGVLLYGIWFIFPALLPTWALALIGIIIGIGAIMARYLPQPKVNPDA